MQSTYVVSFEVELSPENRHLLKEAIGAAVRQATGGTTPVVVDHLGKKERR